MTHKQHKLTNQGGSSAGEANNLAYLSFYFEFLFQMFTFLWRNFFLADFFLFGFPWQNDKNTFS